MKRVALVMLDAAILASTACAVYCVVRSDLVSVWLCTLALAGAIALVVYDTLRRQ